MEKTAQKRSILNKLRELSNISGIAAEKFFNPEFKRVMESLREKDSSIRSLVAGKEIEGGDPGSDPISLKDLLKSAKSNFNRREYMTSVAELGRFHKKLFDIIQVIKSLDLEVDQVHHEFLFKDLGDEHKKQLESLKTRFAKDQKDLLVKEASIMDFFYNIGTKRGRALAAWEKRYPKQVGKLKKDTANLLGKSETFLGQMLAILKEMASARAERHIDNYMKAADKISKAYQNYDKLFKDYYMSNIKGFLEKVELVSPVEPVPDAKNLGKQEIPVAKPEPAPLPEIPSLVVPPMTTPAGPPSYMSTTPVSGPPSGMSITPSSTPTALAPGKVPTIPPPPATPTNIAPDTTPAPPPTLPEAGEEEFPSDTLAKNMWGPKKAHQNFLNALEALSSENPIVLATIINKYAKSIQSADPKFAIELFKIANSIRG